MQILYKPVVIVACILISLPAFSQIRGKIVDAQTKEAIAGATISCKDAHAIASITGDFILSCKDCDQLQVTASGYFAQHIDCNKSHLVLLSPTNSTLQEIVLSASRGAQVKRSEAPIAIAVINQKLIQDTRANSADQLLNKISGVNMVNLGNEQHQMSIRQPMTTRSLFLYLEDGIPIRTTGLFNHNALLEMNLAGTKAIEVIKGPSSAIYGSEAIGGAVNFITAAPTAIPVLKLSAQGNDIGYRRADIVSSISSGKWGFVVNGYYANKHNGYLEYTDFHKGIVTGRVDYRFSSKTILSNSITWLNYYSDMTGGIDSTMFANHSFKNLHTFTYRKVNAVRYRSTLTQQWNDQSKTTVSVLYRDNSIGQNPAYRVKDDYRRQGNTFVGKKDVAHGEINENSFNSYSLIAQHRQQLNWKNTALTGGLNLDLSPSTYTANYIRIHKDTLANKYTSYQNTDSVLTNYATRLNNYAVFASFEFNPVEKLKIVASLRYDLFRFTFNNHLTPSAFSGSPDTINNFNRVSPKLGLTYNFSPRVGIYANYSEGFVPPQVTELYTGVKVPAILPSVFYNYEAGGWIAFAKGKLSADISIYQLNGTNEIISVKLDDGSFINQNAGRTTHRGIEFGLNANPNTALSFRFSGAYSKHLFKKYIEKGIDYSRNEMNNAPNWIYNTEAWYKPSYIRGLRIGLELQHTGNYFADPQNTARAKGYTVLSLRSGYQFRAVELWLNVLNLTNNYYSYITTKGSFGYSYQLAEPINFNIGLACDFAQFLKKKRQ